MGVAGGVTPDQGQPTTLRLAHLGDVDAMAALFEECNPDSVWSRFGHAMVSEYLRHYCTSVNEVAVVATADDRIVGAGAATMRPKTYRTAFYAKNASRLLTAFSIQVRRRPELAAILLQRLFHAIRSKVQAWVLRALGRVPGEEVVATAMPFDLDKTCHMAFLFVAPSMRGRHIGPEMAKFFGREMSEHGYEWCRAYTTADNAAARAALERAGMSCVARSGEGLTFVGSTHEMRTSE